MLSFAVFVAAVAVLAGQSMAGVAAVAAAPMPNTCNVGQKYCGFSLLNNQANYEVWAKRVSDAQPGIIDPYQALYICQTPTSLLYDDFCPRLGVTCQPFESNKCGTGKDDCCAA